MGRRGYPPEFRRKVLDLVEPGRPVVDVARDLGISAQSIYVWRRQDRIDKGLEQGLSTEEKSELTAAKRRIAELEAELAVHRWASELLGKVVPPKGGSRRPERLGWGGGGLAGRRCTASSVSNSVIRRSAAESSAFSPLDRPGSRPLSMRSCRAQV